MKDRSPRILAIVLAAAGFVVSGVLEYVHAKTYLLPHADSFCSIDATLDCSAVALSRFSVLGGIPMPIWGAAGFVAMFAAIRRRSALVLPLTGFASLASIALLVESVAYVGSVCLLCEAVHVLSLLLFGVALWQRKAWRTKPDREALIGIGAFPASLLLIALLLAPRYWEPLTWQTQVPHDTGVTADGHPWVGAAEPVVTVQEWVDYGCPHCAMASNRMRMRLVHDGDEIRVIRRHEPRMRCTKINKGCVPLRSALCAQAQGKFWEMDSWLFVHAPGNRSLDTTVGARALDLDVEAFERCLVSDATWASAKAISLEARAMKIRMTPTYLVDGEKLNTKAVHEHLDGAL